MSRLWLCSVVLLLVGLQVACRSTGARFDPRAPEAIVLTNLTAVVATNQIPPEWLNPPTNAFTLGPGDVMEIAVLGETATRASCLVGPDGRIYFFLLPGLDVWGLTLQQTKELLEDKLTQYLKAKPQVAITLRSVASKRVWLLGRMNAPGVYPLTVPTTILEAIALAGGPITAGDTDLADLADSFFIRQGRLVPINFSKLLYEGDVSQNIYLQPDDFVFLPSALTQQVFVLGAVRAATPVPFRNELTLISATSAAGGPVPGAHLSQVAIVRGSLTEPKVAIVNLKQILAGKAPDILLEPRDIVYVPTSPFQFLGRYVGIIVSTFIRTVAVNEGIRAVQQQEATIGISVPFQ